MRNTQFTLAISAIVLSFAGCTVKEVDQPPLAGPSTVAYSIDLQSNTNTLIQDGLSQARITINARDHMGQPMNGRPLRAEIRVDGIGQDFGSLSTKNPVTGSTLIYTAPPPSAIAQRQQSVIIAVLPTDSGVFGDEFSRQIELILMPQGVILPSNPSLNPLFTITPPTPQVLQTVTFSAATTTNNGAACNTQCLYAWDFGDGTSATGQVVTHQFRTVGNFAVRLTVTDSRGAAATGVQTVPVGAGTPPTALFTTSPATPAVNQDVFFNASQSTPAAGRTITKYEWSFGDGNTGSGVVVSHRYEAAGAYQVMLTVTDDAGSVAQSAPFELTAGQPSGGPAPTAAMTCAPTAIKPGGRVSCNASASRPGSGSNIESYTFDWGDGSGTEVHTNPVQSHEYFGTGTVTVTMTVRDTRGRTATAQTTITIAP